MSENLFDFTLTDTFVINRFSGGSRIFLKGGGAATPKVGLLTYYFANLLTKIS